MRNEDWSFLLSEREKGGGSSWLQSTSVLITSSINIYPSHQSWAQVLQKPHSPRVSSWGRSGLGHSWKGG